MTVLGALSVALEVPDLDAGIRFYSDAGLVGEVSGNIGRMRCEGQDRASVILLGGHGRKRLHHVALRADNLDRIAARVGDFGGHVMPPPAGFADSGLWVQDPHGMLIHLSECLADPGIEPSAEPFAINAPGRVTRTCRSAVLPQSAYPPVKPRRLGHIMLFTPDVAKSVTFVTEALGMGLADQSQDIIAFCCARRDSDHHVVAFAKSPTIGFHHASFEVSDPDEVGRGGRALFDRSGRGDWGFGRHTIGSNFFHYVQDPWGSWFEYYSDMDHIDDYSLWTPTNYDLADSLASWGPTHPDDFVHNYEADAYPALGAKAQ